jgi:UDP-GlcNAc:undecaprenyl-phosphate/decaprenyl-phosphate GlcNAc-1-phosphate transferase
MGEYAKSYLIVLVVAIAATAAATPIVILVARRFGLIDEPGRGDRHVHTDPTPTLGGAAMFVGFLAAIGVASQLDYFRATFTNTNEWQGIVLAATVMFLVGAIDDVRDVSPPAKIAGMVLAATLLSQFGVTMFVLRVPFNLGHQELIVLGPDWATLVTAVWVILMANAVNLVDGLDGLAAGIVVIAGSALFLYSDRLLNFGSLERSNIGPLIALITVGVAFGFLPFNFSPARVFMGDAGALFLGLLVSIPTITVGGRTDVPFSGNSFFFYSPLLIPVLILGVPMIDTVFSFVRRIARRRSWSLGDREHIHHRLLRLGHGPRRAVLILWAWTFLLSGVALLPVLANRGDDRGEVGNVQLDALVPFALAALGLILYIAFHPGVRRKRRLHARAGRRHPSAGGTDLVELEGDGAAPAGVVELEARPRA